MTTNVRLHIDWKLVFKRSSTISTMNERTSNHRRYNVVEKDISNPSYTSENHAKQHEHVLPSTDSLSLQHRVSNVLLFNLHKRYKRLDAIWILEVSCWITYTYTCTLVVCVWERAHVYWNNDMGMPRNFFFLIYGRQFFTLYIIQHLDRFLGIWWYISLC